MEIIRYLGRVVIHWGLTIYEVWKVLQISLWSAAFRWHIGRRATTSVIKKQVYFTGVEAFPIVSWIALFLGIIIVTQTLNIMPRFGREALIGEVLVLVVIRELGPLFAAVIVIARSGTAIAAELGTIKMSRQLTALEVMGIDPMHYMVIPRVIATAISTVVLTFYFEAISILGGYLLAGFGRSVPFATYMSSIFAELGFLTFGASLLKSAVFGLIIGAVCCYHGLMVEGSITRIPQETTKAVIGSLWLLIVADAVITFGLFI